MPNPDGTLTNQERYQQAINNLNARQSAQSQQQQSQQTPQQSNGSSLVSGLVNSYLTNGGSAGAAAAPAAGAASTGGPVILDSAGNAVASAAPSAAAAGDAVLTDSAGNAVATAAPTAADGTAAAGMAGYAVPALGAVGAADILTRRPGGVAGAEEGAASGAALGSAFGPWGTAIGAVAGGAIGYFDKHETTQQKEIKRWGGLANNSGIDKGTLSNLALANHPNGDTGQKWTPEYAAQAMKDPTQMWGTYGMLNTFGGDYFNKMNEFQRYAATKAAIDNGLLKSDHGDIVVTDPDKLKSLLSSAYTNQNYLSAYQAWKANPSGSSSASGAATQASSSPQSIGMPSFKISIPQQKRVTPPPPSPQMPMGLQQLAMTNSPTMNSSVSGNSSGMNNKALFDNALSLIRG